MQDEIQATLVRRPVHSRFGEDGSLDEGGSDESIRFFLLCILSDNLLLDVRRHRLVVAQCHRVASPAARDAF